MFKHIKKIGLQLKITVIISLLLFVMLTLLNLFNSYSVSNISRNMSNNMIKQVLNTESANINTFIEKNYASIEGISVVVQYLLNNGIRDFEMFSDIVYYSLENSDDDVNAIDIMFLDNTLENNSPLRAMYISKNPDGSLTEKLGIGSNNVSINSDFYTVPIATKKPYITPLYLYEVSDERSEITFTLSIPLFIGNDLVGTIGFDIFTTSIQDMVQQNVSIDSSKMILIDNMGTIASIEKDLSSRIGENIYDVFPNYKENGVVEALSSGKYYTFTDIDPNTNKKTIYAIMPIELLPDMYWGILLNVTEDAILKEGNRLSLIVIMVGFIIAILLAVLISIVLKKEVTSIINALLIDLTKLSVGDLAWSPPSFLFKRKDEWADIAHAIDNLLNKLNSVVKTVKISSDKIKLTADKLSDENGNLSARTEAQSTVLEQTAASMEEIASTIKQSSDNSMNGNNMMIESKKSVEKGSEVISMTTSSIEDVLEASSKITNIIKVIENIAFQTNILALNAAVEAARAGEQGRGFAVVATEVRNLAQTTQVSVKNITTLINDVNEKIKIATETAKQSKEIFEDIQNKIETTSNIIKDISTSAVEQQLGIDQINKAVTEIDISTQENASLVDKSMISSKILVEQSNNLMNAIKFFKTENNENE